MLKYFHVPEEHAVRVMPEDLRATVVPIFEKMNVPPADARLAADVLVAADTRGVDTHGVSNMLRMYVAAYGRGLINPRPNWRVVQDSPSAATVDSDGGLGLIVAPKAMEIAIEKARATGVGAVTIANGRHLGMAAYHAMMALEHDMIGYCITAGGANTVPTFGAEPRLGANPHAWAVPAGEEPPFVLDMSSSTIAANKIGLARRHGTPAPPGMLADRDGTPIMAESPAPERPWLLPLGSTREGGSQKGYGLAAMAMVWGGILSGGTTQGHNPPGVMCHFVAAYDIAAFTDVAGFKRRMDAFLRYLRETPPAPGCDRVYYAGLPEHEEEQERRRLGVPLHEEVVEWFDSITSELGLPPLKRRG